MNVIGKWRDTAWKNILCSSAESAIEYLMPDLAADMDRAREIISISGAELFSTGSDSDKYMRETDVFFNIPMLGGESGNVALFAEQQHEIAPELPERVFETYIRLREKLRQPTTCIVIYTGSSPNVNTYAESCYGFKVAVEFRTYHLPEKSIDELRADDHAFARVMLAARLALDAGGSVELREKYAREILNATTAQSYDKGEKFSILKFARRIFQLSEPEISQDLKGEYDMQMTPLKEYARMVELQSEREEGREEGKVEIVRSMLSDGLSLQQVAKISGWPVEDLQKLRPN